MNKTEKGEHPRKSLIQRVVLLLKKNKPRFFLLSLVVLIVLLMSVIGLKKDHLEQEKQAAHVDEKKLVNAVLLNIQPRPVEDAMNLPGTIEPWTRLQLMAKISGSIIEVKVREGELVKAGQVLALMEPDDYRIALDVARAAHVLAKAEYERTRAMHQTKVVPLANLETTAARLQTAGAELERAQLQLSRCRITAPMDCVVQRLDAKVGLYVSIGDPLAELLQIDRVKAVVGIPESDVDAVRRIDTVGVTIQALGNRQVDGKKYYLAQAPDAGAYLFRMELALDNPDHSLLPGMFFRARIVKQRIEKALSVPLYSIISRNDEQYIFVADGEIVRKQPVKLGVIEQWQVQITDGLKPGDQVVVEGHREVENGQQIKVIRVLTDAGEGLL